jgi:hypothetical protein
MVATKRLRRGKHEQLCKSTENHAWLQNSLKSINLHGTREWHTIYFLMVIRTVSLLAFFHPGRAGYR